MWQSILDLKQEPIAKHEWLLHWTEVKEIMKSQMLSLNTITLFTCLKLDTWWHHKGKFQNYRLLKLTANDYGIRPKATHELAIRHVGGPFNLSYTCRDRKNYLQSKRQRELAFGQAGSMLKYFHDKISENPSFQYALQVDCDEHITNIFWADAKMILDYAYFGDVVTFDTTFGTNKEYRPFGVTSQ